MRKPLIVPMRISYRDQRQHEFGTELNVRYDYKTGAIAEDFCIFYAADVNVLNSRLSEFNIRFIVSRNR